MKLPVYFFVVDAKDKEKLDGMDAPKLESGFAIKAFLWSALPADKSLALHKSFRMDPPAALISIADNQVRFPELMQLPFEYRKRWLHYTQLSDFRSEFASGCFAAACLPALKSEHDLRNPIVGVVTSAFHSGDKIMRPYHALRKQHYSNFVWVIVDDSKEKKAEEAEDTWTTLTKLAETDSRIHILKYSQPSGYIGKMKATSAGVCLALGAQWIVELDHDDIIVPELLGWIVECGLKNPSVGFIYSDFIELFEDGSPFHYGSETCGFGFCAYLKTRVNGQFQCVYQSHNSGNSYLPRHIVGVANHVRAWRSDVYQKIGGFNANLPVADDYELLLRTFFETKCLRIAEMAYLQYRNIGGNNFTFLRNELIQDITRVVSRSYEGRIHKRLLELDIPDNPDFNNLKADWQYPKRRFPPKELTWFPKIEETITIVMPTYNRPDLLRRAIASVIAQDYPIWRLFVIGDKCPTLDKFMNEVWDPRIFWWNTFQTNGGPGGHQPRNYAMSIVRTPYTALLDDDNAWEPDHLSSLWKRKNECPGVRCIVSSMKIDGKPLYFWEPKLARIDTSCLFIESELWHEYGNMKNRIDGGYAHDHELVNRWVQGGEPFAATLKCTLNYNITTNGQSYEQLFGWYSDQPQLAKMAADQSKWPKDWNTNPIKKKVELPKTEVKQETRVSAGDITLSLPATIPKPEISTCQDSCIPAPAARSLIGALRSMVFG